MLLLASSDRMEPHKATPRPEHKPFLRFSHETGKVTVPRWSNLWIEVFFLADIDPEAGVLKSGVSGAIYSRMAFGTPGYFDECDD